MATFAATLLQRVMEKGSDAVFNVSLDAMGERVKVMLGDINGEKRKLLLALEGTRGLLAGAEQKQLHDIMGTWLGDLQEVVFDAEDALDEYAADVAVFHQEREEHTGKLSEVWSYISEKLKAYQFDIIRGRLEDMVENGRKYGLEVVVPVREEDRCTPRRRITGGFLPHREELIPRDDAKRKIMDWVLPPCEHHDNTLSILSMVGMGGIGKTTLAQLVFNDSQVMQSFQLRMWVCVSNGFTTESVTKRILVSCLDSKGICDPCDLQDLGALQELLANKVDGHRFLLVLDDIWDVDGPSWDQLLGPLGMEKNGSRVLVTTRKENIARMVMRGSEPLHLGILSDEQILSIMKNNVFKVPQNFEVFGMQMATRLGGSPLAAKTVGRLLNDYGTEDLNSLLSSGKFLNLEQNENDILPVLKLSYDHLTPNLKECFAYCSLFPKDYLMCKDQLIPLWMAQGCIKPGGEGLSMEYWGERHCEDLLSYSLLERWLGNEHIYAMHDLIHDLAESVSKDYFVRVGQKSQGNASENMVPERVRHMSWVLHTHLQSRPDALCKRKKLRTLLFLNLEENWPKSWSCGFDFDDFLDKDVFDNLRRLRLLGLRGSPVKCLPSSINKLKHLRHLDLSHTTIEELPESLGGLWNLQVLDLSFCVCLYKIPPEVGKLKNVIHLVLSHLPIEELPESLGSLCNLQVLDLSFGENLHKIPQEVGKLKNLTCLDISYSFIKELPESLGNLNKLQELNLYGSLCYGKLPDSISQLISLRHLKVDGTILCPTIHPVAMASWRNLCTDAHPRELKPLKELQYLKLYSLDQLTSKEEAGEAELHSKMQLTALKLFFYPKPPYRGHSLPPLDNSPLKHQDVLVGLRPYLSGIRALSIAGYQGEWLPTWMVGSSIPCLWKLKFKHCSNLRFLPPLPPTCVQLTIKNCPELHWPPSSSSFSFSSYSSASISPPSSISSPPSPQWQQQMHLSRLIFRETPPQTISRLLRGIAPSISHRLYLAIFGCEELRSFGDDNDEQDSNRDIGRELEAAFLALSPFLSCLELGCCKNLRSLPSKLSCLHSLEELRISGCPKIESLPEAGLPPSLQCLDIETYCPLQERCREGGDDHPKIAHISSVILSGVMATSAETLSRDRLLPRSRIGLSLRYI